VQLLLLIISRFFHLAPIPHVQNTIPARKPLRVFVYWKQRFALPRHDRRSIAQTLVQANVVVEKRKFAHGLFKPIFAGDFNQTNGALEGAEKAFDSTIRDVRPIHRPSLIGFSRFGRLSKSFAQLQDVIAAFFAQFGDVGFAHRFAAIGKACVERGGHDAAPGVAARLGQQTQNFGFYPAGLAGLALLLACSAQAFAAGEWMRLDGGLSDWQQEMHQQRQNNQQNASDEKTHAGFCRKQLVNVEQSIRCAYRPLRTCLLDEEALACTRSKPR
jgi:hypothetical protein